MKRILLADDDESIRLTLSVVLEDEGFHVDVAASFREAFAALVSADSPYDFVLFDQHLGDGLGTDLVPVVREKMPAAKAILVSGSIEDTVAARLGVDALVLKGAAFPELLAVLR